MKRRNIVLVSGGTGGHVIPAVNFGNYIVKNGHNCYLFVDDRGKKYASSFMGRTIVISSSHLNHNFFGRKLWDIRTSRSQSFTGLCC